MDGRASLALLVTVCIWGVAPTYIRTLSLDLGPADHLSIRYALVSAGYAAGLAALGGWRIAAADWPRLIVSALAGMAGYNITAAYGFALIPAGVGALIIGTQPLLIALFGAVAGGERLTAATVAGLMVAFAGTALLVWHDVGGGPPGAQFLHGSALVFLCGLCWAVYVTANKPLVLKYGSFPITALSIMIATAAMLALFARPATFTAAAAMPGQTWFGMGFMVVLSTGLATIAWNYGAARLSAAATGAFIYLIPVIGVAAGAAILGEPVTATMVAGGSLILAGVAIAQFAPRLGSIRR